MTIGTATVTGPATGKEDRARKEFEQLWTEPSGFPGRLATVDNVRIGVQFLVTAFTFFLLAGALALLMRIQLAVPENTFLGPKVYNRMFTMHGTTMMYLFAVPVMEGLAALFLPMMLGTRDLAYPRLTALSYLFLGLHLYGMSGLSFSWQTNAYGSIFYMLSWAVDVVVLVGLGLAGTALVRAWLTDDHWEVLPALHAQMTAHFWYFAAAGVVVYATLYLSPYLI